MFRTGQLLTTPKTNTNNSMVKFDIKRILNPSMLLLAGAILIQIVALIIYTQTGVNEFNETLSNEVLLFSIINLVFGLLILLVRLLSIDDINFLQGSFDVFIALNYIIALFTFMFYIISQVNYLANVFVSIDGTKISPTFVLTALTILLSFVLYLVSSLLYKKIRNEKPEIVIEGAKSNE